MTTVVDVDKTMPAVEPVPKAEPRKAVTVGKPTVTKWIAPKFRIAVETLKELAEIYTDTADYTDEKASSKRFSTPDRMVSGYLTAAANSTNPIEFLTERIQNMRYAAEELRSAVSEVMNEERRQKEAIASKLRAAQEKAEKEKQG